VTGKRLRKLLSVLALGALLVGPATAQVGSSVEQGLAQLASQIVAKSKAAGKATIAVLPFPNADGSCSVLSNFIVDELVQSLFSVPGSELEIVERSQLEAVMEELKLGASGLLNPETTKKLGSQSGVSALTVGTITVIGDTVRINARLIATDTGKAISAAAVDIPKVAAVSELLKQPVTTGATCAPRQIGTNKATPPPTPGQPSATAAGWIGCYADRGERDLDGAVLGLNDMTTEICVAYCAAKGFSYAGTQYSTQCFCGNFYGKYGASDACNYNCAGNSHETCGGFWANSVYSTSRSR